MRSALQKCIGMMCLVGCVCAAMVFLAGAAPTAEKQRYAKYEYTTASSDLKSLQTELNRLGKNGWEVVSIVRDDLLLATSDDGKNHIKVDNLTIVAKRPQKK